MEKQEVPVKLFKSDDRVTVVAPMPGLEPQDIEARLSKDGELELSGRMRGRPKGLKDLIADEWNPGPYLRKLTIFVPVDGTLANMTYENGVVTVSMPISDSFQPAVIELERVRSTKGRRVGNAGHPPRPAKEVGAARAQRAS